MNRRAGSRPDPWDVATVVLLILVLAGHLAFTRIDVRLPRDPGRYYLDIPDYYWQLDSLTGWLETVRRALVDSTGWYELLIAGTLRLLGRSPRVLELFGTVWLGILLGATGLVARRLAGPAAALSAVALTAAVPIIILMARTTWIHIPEAALLVTMLMLYVHDQGLERRTTAVGLTVLGMATIQLRESGMMWVATFVPLLWFGSVRPGGGRPLRRIVCVVLGWTLALIPPLTRLSVYLQAKSEARARYVIQVPPLAEQYGPALGRYVSLVVVAGLLLCLLRIRRRWSPVAPLLVVWALLPIPLFLIFHAGFDNFTAFVPALAIAAACGLSFAGRPLALAPVLVFSAYTIPQWTPYPATERLRQWLPGIATEPDIRNYYRPFADFGGVQVNRLLDATCPSNDWHGCHVVVEKGLFYPAGEEYGLLELFFTANDRVALRTLDDVPPQGWSSWRVDALAVFDCGLEDDGWLRRNPASPAAVIQLVSDQLLLPVWADRVGVTCQFYWFTHDRAIRDPSQLPIPSRPDDFPPWTPERAQDELRQFQARNPDFARRRGRTSVWSVGQDRLETPPPGWTVTGTDAERARAIASIQPWKSPYIASITTRGSRRPPGPGRPGP